MQNKIKVNLVAGSLGAGKTTFVKNLLQQKPVSEKWLLLINEFGSVGIDGAILEASGATNIEQVPGGCICCTAKNELTTNLLRISQQTDLDRLIIEPTGLGEPEAIIDLFKQPELKDFFEIFALFSVIDTANTSINELITLTIMQSLITMADIIILNKSDLTDAEHQQNIIQHCQSVFPPKEIILNTTHGKIDIHYLDYRHTKSTGFSFYPSKKNHDSIPSVYTSDNKKPHFHEAISTPSIEVYEGLHGLIDRKQYQDGSTRAVGWIFNDETEFHWTKVFQLFQSFTQTPSVKRAKGVFKVAEPWMLFQFVKGQATREFIAYRKDSRIELLLDQDSLFDVSHFEKQLSLTQKSQ